MIQFFRKNFSIEDGGYSGNKRRVLSGGYGSAMLAGGGIGTVIGSITPPGAVVGATIGAGIGAWFNWLANIADESKFNTKISTSCNSYKIVKAIEDEYNSYDSEEDISSTVTTTSDGRKIISTKRKQSNKNPIPTRELLYDIDKDPKKFAISMMQQGSVLVIYLNDLNKMELSIVNEILDSYCFNYKNADYSSHRCGKNSYVIDLKVLDGAEGLIPLSLIENGFKINILTSRSKT